MSRRGIIPLRLVRRLFGILSLPRPPDWSQLVEQTTFLIGFPSVNFGYNERCSF
jgi:hypothetical protein